MPYEQGPFIPQPDSSLPYAAGEYDFTDFTADGMADAQVDFDEFDQTVLIIEALAASADDPLAGLGIENLVGLQWSDTLTEDTLGIPAIDTALSLATGQLSIATSFAPLEAWSDPPAPFIPPDAAIELMTPAIDPNAYYPPAVGVVGVNQGSGRPSVVLANITRVGQPNFVVGDSFEVVALGNPGDDVSLHWIFNGVDGGTYSVGQCDSYGVFTTQGQEGPAEVGTWFEGWYVAGVLVNSFNFLVTSS